MVLVEKQKRRRASVSASELAQMGVCERLVVFEHRYGKRRTMEQQLAIKRGLLAHERFYRERHRDSIRPWRNFIDFLAFWRWLALCVSGCEKARKYGFQRALLTSQGFGVEEYGTGGMTGSGAGEQVGIRTVRRSRRCHCA